ncbi:DUF3221 domain-containing protein [Paenibacillus sonchi]|uniref:DUF3221 domain-containing protein n=1 Tax=Paenibacillus sonchi TaxID=373687 RepID=A0A974SDH2_9BACL|nr:DUF3221 domain-containing protein [Paenibacillus sonchi]QQZ62473.1 DUF3221 domain-containing protein [Paenibacillus sonchi]
MVHKNSTFKRTPILIFICLFLFTSCNKDVEIVIGTVHTIDVENKRILVIPHLKEQDLNKNYKEILNSSEYSQAIWVNKVSPSNYKQGDEIEISYTVSDDSFPAQVTANKITEIKN